MNTLILKRIAKKSTYTIGHLYYNGTYICDTLEDADRHLSSDMSENEILKIKIKSKTAIPTGTYLINMHTISPKFKNRSWAQSNKGVVPRLENVKGYAGVLIHPGNKPEDTDGCILVGENTVKGQVINSVATYTKLLHMLNSKNNWQIQIC